MKVYMGWDIVLHITVWRYRSANNSWKTVSQRRGCFHINMARRKKKGSQKGRRRHFKTREPFSIYYMSLPLQQENCLYTFSMQMFIEAFTLWLGPSLLHFWILAMKTTTRERLSITVCHILCVRTYGSFFDVEHLFFLLLFIRFIFIF
jgi:hypothetical protein